MRKMLFPNFVAPSSAPCGGRVTRPFWTTGAQVIALKGLGGILQILTSKALAAANTERRYQAQAKASTHNTVDALMTCWISRQPPKLDWYMYTRGTNKHTPGRCNRISQDDETLKIIRNSICAKFDKQHQPRTAGKPCSNAQRTNTMRLIKLTTA